MSPIINLQRRLHEDGRIRIGHQVGTARGGKRPAKLNRLRFTSQNQRAIRAIAKRYGGDPRPWADAPVGEQWEVFTEAVEIPVVVPPETMAFSQWMELWSAGGCKRRCDTEHETISDGPCLCDPERPECRPHTRLSVMLAEYPGTGLWRIETHGHYAKVELAGAFELAQLLTQTTGRSVLAAQLRLEVRQVKRVDAEGNPRTLTFPVPILDFEANLGMIALGRTPMELADPVTGELPDGAPERPAPGLTPVPQAQLPAPPLAEQLDAVDSPPPSRRRSNAPPPIPPTGLAPRTAVEAERGDATTDPPPRSSVPAEPERSAGPEPLCTPAQIRQFQRLFAKLDITERPARLRYASNLARRDVSTTKELTVAEANALISNLKEVTGEEPPPSEGDDQ